MKEVFLSPHYINNTDIHWIEEIFDIFQNCIGKNNFELETRLNESNWKNKNTQKYTMIKKVLDRIFLQKISSTKNLPSQLRMEAFLAQEKNKDYQFGKNIKDKIFSQISSKFEISIQDAEHIMMEDLSVAQKVSIPKSMPSIEDIILLSNLELIKNILSKTEFLKLKIIGNSNQIVRVLRWQGFIFHIKKDKEKFMLIDLCGPLSLLRNTKIYGSKLANLVSILGRCEDFNIYAKTKSENLSNYFQISKSDPFYVNPIPKKFDSKIEENFQKNLKKISTDWILTREPKPLQLPDGHLIFPDFLIRHTTKENLFFYLEIIGFWTKKYIETKTHQYHSLENKNVILCIKDSIQFEEKSFDSYKNIIKFKTQIRACEVLKVLENYI